MLWLYLHFPQLPLDHVSRGIELPIPFAIVTGVSPLIKWSNDTATKHGVKPGMSLNTAYCLLPELKIIHHDPQKMARVLKELAATAYQYSSHITLYPPDGLLLEAGSMLKLFGGLNELWNKLYAEMSNQGFVLNLATGPTPLSARLLARNNKGQCSSVTKELLLPIESLNLYEAELPKKTAERCYRMGIKTLNQLISLPFSELNERFGPDLKVYIDKVIGKESDPQVAYTVPPCFLRHLDFIEEITHINGVLFPLQRTLRGLSDYLISHQLSTDTLSLSLLHRNHPDTYIHIRCAQPEHSHDVFIQLCRLQLERYPIPEAIIALALKVDQLTPLEISNTDLFDSTEKNQNSFLQLVGKLHARLGDQSIKKLTVRSDHRPEKSQQFLSAAATPKKPTNPAKPTKPTKPIINHTATSRSESTEPSEVLASDGAVQTAFPYEKRRPLWLFKEPAPITPHSLVFISGPERISSGWWDNNTVLRDYYIARFPHGALGWVFRDISNQWFLQGWFA